MSAENSASSQTSTPVFGHLGPAVITFLVSLLIMGLVIARAGGDPLGLARLGTRFSQADPTGSEGYDGQFIYYIAVDPDPAQVAEYLDVPAYRYQRILLPLLARLIGGGDPTLVAWALAALGLFAHALGTWAVTQLLVAYRVGAWYALIYGLWVGLLLAVRLDLPEPLAYGLVAAALLAHSRNRAPLAAILFGLALFAKETTVIFVFAYLLTLGLQGRWSRLWTHALISLGPFALFQGWLWSVFGQPGIGSGGAGATPFEIWPFAGFYRIALASLPAFLIFAVVFGPSVVAMALGGIVQLFRRIRQSTLDLESLIYGLNALVIPFLPFSTIREPGGLLRFSSGLLLAFLIFAAQKKRRRALNYAFFLIALNAFLIE